MQSIIFPLTLSTLAGLSTLIGAIFIFFKIQDKNLNKFISFCLAFSISVMITISILDLIPTSFFQISNIYGVGKSILILIIAFIISYIVITYLSVRIEKETHSADLYKLGILNMIVLILHNLPEGIATFLSSYHNTSLGIKLSVAICFIIFLRVYQLLYQFIMLLKTEKKLSKQHYYLVYQNQLEHYLLLYF